MKSNINRVISGLFYTILGAVIAVGPHTFFAVCEGMDGKYMKCHWTAQAETGAGSAIAILGLFLLLFSSKEIRKGIQISLLPLLVVSLLLPNVLIGVCGGEHMVCHSLTLPVLNILGILGLVVGLIELYILFFKKERLK